eukprot:2984820-Rhodomonas_salina.1
MTKTSEAADSRLTTCSPCCWGGILLLSSKIHIKYLLSVGEVTFGEPEVILWPVRGPADQVLCQSATSPVCKDFLNHKLFFSVNQLGSI